jgi:hypothetical protein
MHPVEDDPRRSSALAWQMATAVRSFRTPDIDPIRSGGRGLEADAVEDDAGGEVVRGRPSLARRPLARSLANADGAAAGCSSSRRSSSQGPGRGLGGPLERSPAFRDPKTSAPDRLRVVRRAGRRPARGGGGDGFPDRPAPGASPLRELVADEIRTQPQPRAVGREDPRDVAPGARRPIGADLERAAARVGVEAWTESSSSGLVAVGGDP